MQSIKKKIQDKNTSITSKEGGFTIIEVMIVLVIAAVIILIVFLAVPALQRNSRNNQRSNDAARVSASVTEFANNNRGELPDGWSDIESYVGDLGFYDRADFENPEGSISEENIYVVTNATCEDNEVESGGTDRQFVVAYAVETGGDSTQNQCLEG